MAKVDNIGTLLRAIFRQIDNFDAIVEDFSAQFSDSVHEEIKKIYNEVGNKPPSEIKQYMFDNYPSIFDSNQRKDRVAKNWTKFKSNLRKLVTPISTINNPSLLLTYPSKNNLIIYQKLYSKASDGAKKNARRKLSPQEKQELEDILEEMEITPTHPSDFRNLDEIILSNAILDQYDGTESIQRRGTPQQMGGRIVKPPFGDLLGIDYSVGGAKTGAEFKVKEFKEDVLLDLEEIGKHLPRMGNMRENYFRLFFPRALSGDYINLEYLTRYSLSTGRDQRWTPFFEAVLKQPESQLVGVATQLLSQANIQLVRTGNIEATLESRGKSLVIPKSAFDEETNKRLDAERSVQKRGGFYVIPLSSATGKLEDLELTRVNKRTGKRVFKETINDVKAVGAKMQLRNLFQYFMRLGVRKKDFNTTDSQSTLESTFFSIVFVPLQDASFRVLFSAEGSDDLNYIKEKIIPQIADSCTAVKESFIKVLREDFMSEVQNPKSKLYLEANSKLRQHLVEQGLIEEA